MDTDSQTTDQKVPEVSEVPQEVQDTIEVQAERSDDPKKWYVIHVKTGYEGRVKSALEQ